MTSAGRIRGLGAALMASVLTAALVMSTGGAHAYAAAPVKQVLLAHFGENVNKTKTEEGAPPVERNVCMVASGDECQSGKESTLGGGFAFPTGVAIAPNGDLYVTDSANNRIEELTPTGEFLEVFGWEVNQAKDKSSTATQAEKNVCTAASGDTCAAGVGGSLAGQTLAPVAITVDSQSGNIFVQDAGNERIDEFMPEGRFVLMIGGEVDKTKTQEGSAVAERNVCTAASGDECQQGQVWNGETQAPGAFKFSASSGDLLTIGGPEDLLYVGDEDRVQEFDPRTGQVKGEIPLEMISKGGQVVTLTLNNSCATHDPVLTESTTPTCKEFDPEYGTLYLVYSAEGVADTVRKFSPGGVEVKDGHFPMTFKPRNSQSEHVFILGLAVDPANRLAVSEVERPLGGVFAAFGGLYDRTNGRLMTEFSSSSADAGMDGLTFAGNGELYATITNRNELGAYHPVSVAELLATGAPCTTEADKETSVAYDCSLRGQVDPWGVPRTEVWFEWGKTTNLGETTPPKPVGNVKEPGEEEAIVQMGELLEGLLPNSAYYYRLAAYDANVIPPESHISSETISFMTPYTRPRIMGRPTASFVEAFSTVLYGEVNPENAETEYFVEYTPERRSGETLAEVCPNGLRTEPVQCEEAGVVATSTAHSNAYGRVPFTQEAKDLNPATKYRARVFAESHNMSESVRLHVLGEEGEFDSTPPVEVQAKTGLYSSVTTTSAVITGSVDPGGRPAISAFELATDNGTAGEYITVFTAGVPANTAPVTESFTLTGLQPATQYAYRIRLQSGYGIAVGQPVAFTTLAFATTLGSSEPGQLPIPKITFPRKVPKCRTANGHRPNVKCVKRHHKKKNRKHPKKHTKITIRQKLSIKAMTTVDLDLE